MNKLLYTSYSPNTRTNDLQLNLKLLFQPNKYLNGVAVARVIEFFQHNYADALGVYAFNYARSGMYLLFKSLQVPTTSEILVTGFTCSAAVNPVLWAGLTPKYVDIDSSSGNMNLDALKHKVNEKTKAILFQHTFGNSSGISEVKQFCEAANLILIEDCTNTILGRNGKTLLGSYGDFAIFSFGRDKAISGINGGIILINNSNYVTYFENLYKDLPHSPTSWVFKELLYPIIWGLIKKTYTVKLGKLLHVIFTKLKLLSRASTDDEKHGIRPHYIPTKLPDALATLAIKQLNDIAVLNEHRLAINKLYYTELKLISKVALVDFDEGNVLLRFPIIVPNKEALVRFLKKKNILVGDWYSSPITPVEDLNSFHYQAGQCPTSEKLCSHILNLPNHINITSDDALYICKTLKDYYAI